MHGHGKKTIVIAAAFMRATGADVWMNEAIDEEEDRGFKKP